MNNSLKLIQSFLLGMTFVFFLSADVLFAAAVSKSDLTKVRNPFVSYLPEKKEEPKSVIQEPVKPIEVSVPPIDLEEERRKNLEAERLRKIEEEAKIVAPNLMIQGVIWNSPKPQVIVDGQVLGIGDSIQAAEIQSISQAGIGIIYKEKFFSIKYNSGIN